MFFTRRSPPALCSVAVATLTALGALSQPASAVQLQVTQLPFLPSTTTAEGMGLNSKGEVVGIALDGQGSVRSWYWSAAAGAKEIGAGVYSSAFVYDINDGGMAVGNGSFANGTQSFTWQNGALRLVGTNGTALRGARGINNAGAVVGEIPGPNGTAGAAGVFYPRGSQPVSLGIPAGGRGAYGTAINERGTVVGYSSASNGSLAFIWTGIAGMRELNTPLGTAGAEASGVNAQDDVVGSVLGPDGIRRAAFWSGGTGMPTLVSGAGAYTVGFNLNDIGQMVGVTGEGMDSTKAFLWSRSGGLVMVDSLLAPGSTVGVLSVRDITAEGVMVGRGTNGSAVLITPTGTLNWQGVAGGRFNDATQWEHGFAPGRLVDVAVAGPSSQTVTMGNDTTVKSLTVGGGSGRPTVTLQNGAQLIALSGSVVVEGGGTLAGDGRIAGSVLNHGTVQPVHLRIDGGLTNQGLLTGTGRIDGNVVNTGAIRVGAGQSLVLAGQSALTNSGKVEVRGGELETRGSFVNAAGGRISLEGGVLRAADGVTNRGSIEFGFGSASVLGTVVTTAGGRVVVSGTGQALFYDGMEVLAGGELRVAAGSQALFYGMMRQRNGALMSGTGTKFYEGGLAIGNSPGVAVDEGNISFGTSNVYEAELGDNAYDRLLVGGELHFGGTLKLMAWDGFEAHAGQRFDLFDWGAVSGAFDTVDTSALDLGAGLAVDTSRLYLDGTVAITAVPEPAPSALLALGMATLALRRLRASVCRPD